MPGPDLSGEVLDRRYRIIERISEGAMGVVYRGVRTKLDRPVAIKVLHLALPKEMKARERFEREAQLMARLDHPHCVSIIDYGVHEQNPYVVMELVRGHSLHDMLAEQARFEIPRAIDIMRQILSGLAHAHDQGIIHRDIKPANIMITPKAPLGLHVRILDFGLARMLGADASFSSDVAVGTPSYMAPEQCRGEPLDARVDIYACGIVLFEMLTGIKPLTSDDPLVTLRKQTDEAPRKLAEVTPGNYGPLEDIVARALQKAPADRFRSAAAMSEALDAALRRTPESTAVLPKVRPAAPPAEREVDSSALIPVTVDSDVLPKKIVRPVAPKSRKPVVALLLALAAAGVAAVFLWRELVDDSAIARPAAKPVPRDAAVIATPTAPPADAPPPPEPVRIEVPPDPAAGIITAAQQMAAAGKLEPALDMVKAGRGIYPDRAELPLLAGKLYFAKFWWTDGIASFRDAIKLDPSLRNDRELVETAVHGFMTTPDWDGRLSRFVTELGPAARPLLDELARTHAVPALRARAAALAQRLPK